MSDIRESTETFLRDKVEPRIKEHVDRRFEDHMESTQAMQTQTIESMKRLHEFQDVMTATIIGTLPPDPDKPSMWESLQDLIGWKKTVNKFLWITATAAIGALVTTIWRMVISSGVQS